MSGGLNVGGEALSKASRAMWYINCKICTTNTKDRGISSGGLLGCSKEDKETVSGLVWSVVGGSY